MTFSSILDEKGDLVREIEIQPEFFSDLNLDQVIDGITEHKQQYNLKPFFYAPLRDVDAIRYRQEVLKDLQHDDLRSQINDFCETMIVMRRYLDQSARIDYAHFKQGWFLEAVHVYCVAVNRLAQALDAAALRSRGMNRLREFLRGHVHSQAFQELSADVQSVKEGLAGVQYTVIIQPGKVMVRKYKGEADYSPQVEEVFEKFKKGGVKDYLKKLTGRSSVNQVDAKILEFVAKLFPGQFEALDRFCENQARFVHEVLSRFDREVQFYLAYLALVDALKVKGLEFCYPEVQTASKGMLARRAYDIALAYNHRHQDTPIICNDLYLHGSERILAVTGPNQGGKTTCARMFGQLHYLASLGYPVPGTEAALFVPDRIYTHFEREEDIRNLRGKLKDDLVRIREALGQATSSSLFIMNEIFSSTTLEDSLLLSKEILDRLTDLDALSVWVTFIDELASLNEKTVSMVACVNPQNPAVRTFKVIRKQADGLAYALSIAEKHGLTYEQIKERISR